MRVRILSVSARKPGAKRTARKAGVAVSPRVVRGTRSGSRKGGKKRSSMSATCSLDSIEDLNLQNICACAHSLQELLAEIRQMMEQPQQVVEKLMVDKYYRYGPKKIKGSPGWWFKVYRPEIKITSNDKLKLTVKAGVKKTRGALQFGWRTADHTFTMPLPAQYQQYTDVVDRIGETESQLNLLIANVCGPLGY